MNKAYIISYHIKSDPTNYLPLFEHIKNNYSWWHYLDNTWIIISKDTAKVIYDKLSPFLDADINILIFELGKDRQGWLPKKAWNWIKENVGDKNAQ